MSRVDANGAWWYVLGTDADFEPRLTVGQQPDPRGPQIGSGAAYSPDREVLDLLPTMGRRRNSLLPGRAIDIDGDSYLVVDGRLVVERCDGSREPLPCEPGVIVDPHGLALDRRGLLYVADRRRRRVVVIDPADGRVEARLTHLDMREPVDVAVAPDGSIFVADRGAGDLLGLEPGRIIVFDSRFEPRTTWIPRNDAVPPRPRRSRPIAVFTMNLRGAMRVVVADEQHPRLLVFATTGEPIGERELVDLVAAAEGDFDPGAPLGVEGFRVALARFVGMCGCPPDLDVGHALATSHRLMRLHELGVERTFRSCGRWTSAVLDSGRAGTEWHRIELNVSLPDSCTVRIDTATSDDAAQLEDVRDAIAAGGAGCPPPNPPDIGGQVTWDVLLDNRRAPVTFRGAPAPLDAPRLGYDIAATSSVVREQLVMSPPGRYLRLRVELHGDGTETPAVRAIKVVVPRQTYTALLPEVFSQHPEASSFLDRFLSLFERSLTGIEETRDDFYRHLAPAAAPPDVLEWLGSLLDLSFDPSWPVERRRLLLAEAMDLYRRRGTPGGLRRYIEVYTGVSPVMTEDFLDRPVAATTAGRQTVIGKNFGVGIAPSASMPPQEALMAQYAHRFTVHLPLADPCDREVVVAVVERIIETNKPAHTAHRLRVIDTDTRLDVDAVLGVDVVLGARTPQRTRLSSGSDRPVLGHDTVLRPARPYPRSPKETLTE